MRVAITLALSFLWGCAATQQADRRIPTAPDALHPTERLMVHGGASTKPMAVVKDDTSAGRRFLSTAALPLSPKDPDASLLVKRMQATLAQEKGVGIAAVQVGISRRVVLVQRFEAIDDQRGSCDEQRCPIGVYFNPRILASSKRRELGWEGCLSVPAGFGQVRRAHRIQIAYQDSNGKERHEWVKGFTARIFQHEIDHLHGVLFLERKEPGELLSKEAYRAMRKGEQQ